MCGAGPGVRQNDIGGPGRRAPRRNPCDHAVFLLRVWARRGQCHSGGHLPARSRLACDPSLLRRNAGPPSTVEHPAMARASATAPAADARSAWRLAGCGRRRFGWVIMVGSHPVVVRMAPLAGGSAEPPAEGIHKDTDGPDQASECVQQFAHLPGRRLAPADFGMSASRLGEGPTSMPRGLPEQSSCEHRAVPCCRGKDQRGSFSLGWSGGVTRPSRLMKRAGGSGCACSSSSRRASAGALPAARFEGTNFSAAELTAIFSPA